MRKLKNEELKRLTLEEFKTTKKFPLSVALDNVRSMHNVGATFRTCDAFLVNKLYLTGITAQPPHREIHKTALGATDSVDWEHHEDPAALIKYLKEQGTSIVAVEQTDRATPLQEFAPDPKTPICVVFGHEVFGVSDEVVSLADHCLEIPQFGTKHSLNISVSVGIVLWDYFSKTGFLPHN